MQEWIWECSKCFSTSTLNRPHNLNRRNGESMNSILFVEMEQEKKPINRMNAQTRFALEWFNVCFTYFYFLVPLRPFTKEFYTVELNCLHFKGNRGGWAEWRDKKRECNYMYYKSSINEQELCRWRGKRIIYAVPCAEY